MDGSGATAEVYRLVFPGDGNSRSIELFQQHCDEFKNDWGVSTESTNWDSAARMDDTSGADICRVCRSEGQPDRPLFHPCICTGSIKWIHQECLVQWMRYSRKEYCELCSHRFSFTPIYSPDMPRRLPIKDVVGGLLSSIVTALKYWLHYTLVAFAWLGLVPLTACRIYRCLFSGSFESILTLPFEILKTQNMLADVFHGCFVVTCTLFGFLGMFWLREQVVLGGGPDWLEAEQDVQQQQQQQQQRQPQQQQPQQQQQIQESANDNVQNPQGAGAERQPARASSSVDDSTATNTENCNGSSEANDANSGDVPDSSGISLTSNDNVNSNLNSGNVLSRDSASGSSSGVSGEVAHASHSSKDTGKAGGSRKGNGHLEKSFKNYSKGGNAEKVGKKQCDYTDLIGGINSLMSIDCDFGADNDRGSESDYGSQSSSDDYASSLDEEQDEGQENNPSDEPLLDENQMGAGGPEADAPEAGGNAQDDGNWNPIEWDRAVEELTWERLLGLDGSLVFLEHVFWVVILNTLFIFFFAFLPYHFGNLAICGLGLREKTLGTQFEGLITTLCGYCILGLCLVLLHSLAGSLGMPRSKRILGLCYVIVKVSLLSVVEIGVQPLICGWWLDICSLSMFDATLKDRETNFRVAPGTSMFIHWLVGMVYVYYFANFVLLLREVVRPGVLWFLMNLNDPDFSPIQEMIHTPIIYHIRQLLVSSIIFGTTVLLMLWLPVVIIRHLWPTFLPYAVALQIEAQMNELSLELLLFQVILPALLEQSHTRVWMKGLIRLWCKCAAWVLGIHSYLLGDEGGEANGNREEEAPAENNNDDDDENLGFFNGFGVANHPALWPREGPVGVQSYVRPSWFYARLMGLLLALCVSLVIASLAALTIPVWIGRKIMAVWVSNTPTPSAPGSSMFISNEHASTKVHELYTAACGTYLCWLTARGISLLHSWLPQDRAAILNMEKIKNWFMWGVKSVVAFTFLLGIIPLLFGLLLELVVVVPLRVPLDQTPVLFVWQDWALGLLYTKIACAVIMMGPDWRMRRAIERVYRDGIRNMDLSFILCDLAIPVTAYFSLALAVPYATAHSVIPLIISNAELKLLIARLLYPCLLLAYFLSGLIALQIRQFKKLYEHIKNDKYLVGKRLVNYDHRNRKSTDES